MAQRPLELGRRTKSDLNHLLLQFIFTFYIQDAFSSMPTISIDFTCFEYSLFMSLPVFLWIFNINHDYYFSRFCPPLIENSMYQRHYEDNLKVHYLNFAGFSCAILSIQQWMV